MRYSLHLLFCLILSMGVVICAKAQVYTLETIPAAKMQNPTTYVSNPDGILTQATEHHINKILEQLEAETSIDVAVVVVKAVNEDDLDRFANDLFNRWRIGKPGRDNGLLVFFVLNERFLRIETGYGLEGDLPDAVCNRIMRNNMFPAFKSGDYDKGMLEGVTAIVKRLTPVVSSETEGISFDPPQLETNIHLALPPNSPNSEGEGSVAPDYSYYNEPDNNTYPSSGWSYLSDGLASLWSWPVYFLLNGIFVVWAAVSLGVKIIRTDRSNPQVYEVMREHLTGKKGCVMFLFPLLIAYILLVRFLQNRVRRRPVPCPACKPKMMTLLEGKKPLAYLSDTQQLERSLKSVYYDVWCCDTCAQTKVCSYINPRSKFQPCSSCAVRAYSLVSEKTIIRATTSHSGKGIASYECQNCRYKESKEYIIPRISSSSGSSGSGSSSGSSSRSSSGSSSRGRSSGGGGSSGRW